MKIHDFEDSPLILPDIEIKIPCPIILCLEISERSDLPLGYLVFFWPSQKPTFSLYDLENRLFILGYFLFRKHLGQGSRIPGILRMLIISVAEFY